MPWPPAFSCTSVGPSPCMPLAPPPPHALPPPGPHLTPHPACPPFGDSRQHASSFNQPLSFDTSSVTNMWATFSVRSSPCPTPNLQSSPPVHAACAAVARHLPPPGPHLAPHRMPSFHFDLAASGGVQPAAELRHVQRHDHGIHVQRAPRACPGPRPSVGPSPCTPLAPHCRPHSLPASRPAPHPASYALHLT